VDDLLPLVEAWRSRKRRIVFAQGSFDGIYANDVKYLQEAALLGDRLIVGVSKDDSKSVPGSELHSPNDGNDRATVVAALATVDAVILCDERTPLELIKAVRPDVELSPNDEGAKR
jgi:D-beta-D-heptose 7-phosphate kinase/D-beta-D-heptose 1-phosphate adenosyltransferase